jgi:hypothetical protein
MVDWKQFTDGIMFDTVQSAKGNSSDKVTVAERKARYSARAKSKKAFSNKRRGKHVDLPTDASIGQT